MDSVRCKNCNKLLFKGGFKHIEIKCPRCKRYIVISNAKGIPRSCIVGKEKNHAF
ncbi:Com family DNA-binding transcriptional regulator [Escherichia coli]|uniref:Com family DNA-binding transcriptional regulator n=1 Tax=Escherichia coli TaxID=562 RepID=UPI002FCD0E82